MIKHLIAASLLVLGASAMAQPRFTIERDIPGAFRMTPDQLRDSDPTSNWMLHDMGPGSQWVQSNMTVAPACRIVNGRRICR